MGVGQNKLLLTSHTKQNLRNTYDFLVGHNKLLIGQHLFQNGIFRTDPLDKVDRTKPIAWGTLLKDCLLYTSDAADE